MKKILFLCLLTMMLLFTGCSDAGFVFPDEILPGNNPYIGVSKESFYENYKPAISALDAKYRTECYLMSGSIDKQDQHATVEENQPTQDGLLLRNSNSLYSEDFNTYYVVDKDGIVVNEIYKDGAYVTLEDVAAYIYAYGDIPANYTSSKVGIPNSATWGEYLRLNNTYFSGDTSRYPFEPELPNISGCGGTLQYYEIDLGTTGTDCDPSYAATDYNNGTSINRGAARIVYSRIFIDGEEIVDVEDRFVFYTYNHYNDFQEYLNYYNGWGTMFGNITGGGTISSREDYNPTPYVSIVLKDMYDYTQNLFTTYYIEALVELKRGNIYC